MARPTRVSYVLQSLLLLSSSMSAVFVDETLFATPLVVGPGVEYYEYDNRRFVIYMEKVMWHEAQRLCLSRQGALVEYTSDKVSAFIGRALAESAVGFASLWIGGQFTPSFTPGEDGVWQWIGSQDLIQTQLDDVIQFPMTSPPYWVDEPIVTSQLPLCLATDRNKHHNALIVSEPCEMKRPYICSLPKGNETIDPKLVITPPITIEGKTFHFFGRFVTWPEAHSQCRLLGMKLAKLTTAKEFRIVKNKMLRERPVMENAWIRGINTEGRWLWSDDNAPINVDPSQADDRHPFPWYREDNIIMEGCLLADRHLCDHFVYVEAKCDRRRSFICEKDRPGRAALPPLIQVYDTPYYVSSYGVDWFKAQNDCKTCLDGELIHIETTKQGVAMQLPILYAAMALILQSELRHIWVGGYLFGTTFKWANDPSSEPSDENRLTEEMFRDLDESGDKGRLIYCRTDFRSHYYLRNYKCLNLDRDNQKYFSLYGIKCHHKQHFICQALDGQKINSACLAAEAIHPQFPLNTRPTSRPSLPPLTKTKSSDAVLRSVADLVRWIRVENYTGYWMNELKAPWEESKRTCQECLQGELLKIVEPQKGQMRQVAMIDMAMKTMPKAVSMESLRRIWLGSIDFEGKFKSPMKVDKSLPFLQVQRKVNILGKKCPALIYNGGELMIISEGCFVKRSSICKTSPDEVLDPEC